LPEYHVKILRFDPKLLILNSIRKPKRLTIVGDDTKEYMFLVKNGEDLRLDQRIEQLFTIMNGILINDSACSQRNLQLCTYNVIPMTSRFGLIEWLKDTQPLKDFMNNQLLHSERKKPQDAIAMQGKWLKTKFGGDRNYTEMFKKAKAADVEREYLNKVLLIPWDLLRRSFMNISANPEAFLIIRSRFIKTLASINICHYILGIGDRHLSNFMIDLKTGGMIGIDFGHAFHSATQFLPIPELMPFRLTPQFKNLISPHKVSGQLRSCMIYTLRALKISPFALINTMDVFIKEPSLEWEANAKKQAATLNKDVEEVFDWFPKERIQICKRKLNNANSRHLLLKDLERGFKTKSEFKSLKLILLGSSSKQCESIEEQVDCLIDHATDPNILGRTWAGWEPWV
jgi:DNA-dependent protein kinase catalytic subunit